MPSRRPSINVIAWNNGVGLSRDMALLKAALTTAGFDVTLTQIGRGKLRKWFRPAITRARHALHRWLGGQRRHDATLMLEHIRPEEFGSARLHFFVPNPEWCLESDVAVLPQVDAVLTKTQHAGEIFSALHRSVAHIGFTSEDRHDASVSRRRAFFHLAGRSANKGTAALCALWARHPEWPVLTIVQNTRSSVPVTEANNIHYQLDYLDDGALRYLQNAHWWHLCPSETEGFGHYLLEAMSVGAIAITTNASPMNELVGSERGLLVSVGRTGVQNLATTHYFDQASMEVAIENAMAMTDAELHEMGGQARRWYLDNHANFPQRLHDALAPRLLAASHA